MAINTEMNVTGIAEYKSAMSQAQQAVKTLDAELKLAETQYKNTGDKEQYAADKTRILQQRLQQQSTAVKNAEQALKGMRERGEEGTAAYQQMERALYNAKTGMLETTGALNQLKQGELEAATGADQLTTSVNGISKKISLDQVITGVDKISTGLENAAKRAVSLGEALWNALMDRARWADDTATAANMLDMNVEDYQKYKKVFDTIGELTIQDWANAKRRVQNAIYSPSSEQIDILDALGISTHEGGGPGKYSDIEGTARDWEDVFWDVATRVQERVQNGAMTQGLADTYMQALFGKGYMNYKSLIDLGAEGFREAVEDQSAVSEESVNKLAELNDTVAKLQGKFKDLESEVLSGLAPALTEGANAMSGLLDKVLEYLQTEDGQKMISDLGTAVSGLFDDLGKIDPEQVVSGFVSVFNTITDGLKWLLENKSALGDVLVGIVTAWAGAKLTGGALQVLQLVNGVKDLFSGGGGGDGTTATTGSGSTGSGGGGNFWTNAINTAALAGSAASFYRATEGNMKQQLKDFYSRYGGLSIEEQADLMWMQTTGMSPAEYNYRKNSDGGGEFFGTPENPVEVTVTPVAEEGSAQSVSDQVGTVDINGIVHITGVDGEIQGVSGNWWGGDGTIVRPHRVGSHANGIPWVPRDGYLAVLHAGERVMPARENKHYTYNNNTYFGSVALHNGLEIEALTESIARNNRRKSNGYGA